MKRTTKTFIGGLVIGTVLGTLMTLTVAGEMFLAYYS